MTSWAPLTLFPDNLEPLVPTNLLLAFKSDTTGSGCGTISLRPSGSRGREASEDGRPLVAVYVPLFPESGSPSPALLQRGLDHHSLRSILTPNLVLSYLDRLPVPIPSVAAPGLVTYPLETPTGNVASGGQQSPGLCFYESVSLWLQMAHRGCSTALSALQTQPQVNKAGSSLWRYSCHQQQRETQ